MKAVTFDQVDSQLEPPLLPVCGGGGGMCQHVHANGCQKHCDFEVLLSLCGCILEKDILSEIILNSMKWLRND